MYHTTVMHCFTMTFLQLLQIDWRQQIAPRCECVGELCLLYNWWAVCPVCSCPVTAGTVANTPLPKVGFRQKLHRWVTCCSAMNQTSNIIVAPWQHLLPSLQPNSIFKWEKCRMETIDADIMSDTDTDFWTYAATNRQGSFLLHLCLSRWHEAALLL